MSRRPRRAFTLIELLVVVGLLALLVAVLLPMLSRARKSAVMSKMASEEGRQAAGAAAGPPVGNDVGGQGVQPAPAPRPPAAVVRSFDADITLTPRLSVGTAEPESIYEATFAAKLDAMPGAAAGPGQPATAESEILLPLPPQIISLADLTVTVDGQVSEAVTMRGDKLVWQGVLRPDAPAMVDVRYTAVGKGLYTLQTPPGACWTGSESG